MTLNDTGLRKAAHNSVTGGGVRMPRAQGRRPGSGRRVVCGGGGCGVPGGWCRMLHVLLLLLCDGPVWCTCSRPGSIGSILRVLLVRLWVRCVLLVLLRPLLVLRVLVRPVWRCICAILGVCGLAGVPGGLLETLLLPVLLLRVCLPLMLLLLLPLGRRPLLLWPLLLLGCVRHRRCVWGRPL